MKHFLLSCLFFQVAFGLSAQTPGVITLSRTLKWAEKPEQVTQPDGSTIPCWTFQDCHFDQQSASLPVYMEQFDLPARSSITVEIINARYEAFTGARADASLVSSDITPTFGVALKRQENIGWVRFRPYRMTGGGALERLVSFDLRVNVTQLPEAPVSATDRGGPDQSALADGSIYKFGIQGSGVYKLDYAFLKNKLGISNLDNIDPRTIKLLGNGGAMLSEKNSDPRPDDLIENAIVVIGESDGKFDQSDYILFYAAGPERWTYRPSNVDPELTVRKHLYDRYAYYFIKVAPGNGLRMSDRASIAGVSATEEFDDFRRFEEEKTNLLDYNTSSQGSGKRWLGDYFNQDRSNDYILSFPNIVTTAPARFRAEFAARSAGSSTVRFTPQGNNTITVGLPAVTINSSNDSYASSGVARANITPVGDDISIKVEYPEISTASEGWLDYIEVNARRRLTMSGAQMEFRDIKSLQQSATTFKLTGGNNVAIWDITNPQLPVNQQFTKNGNIQEFGAATAETLRNFIAWETGASLPSPELAIGGIPNQNLHGLSGYHMAIIYHPNFEAQARRLAEHRKSISGLDIAVVNINEVLNEYSSGAKDPSAIRDFARMLLNKNPEKFEYLLLFGDGSFDPKNNTNSEDNLDFIPVWETASSFHHIYSFPSDDFYALLSPNEDGTLSGALDIAVGRITARTNDEATIVVDKIIAYDKDPATLGDWHLRGIYIADDEDNNAHILQADKLANETGTEKDWANLDKIYLDAYRQVSTSGGQRFPDAKAAINSSVFKGGLILQYVGHGGPRGWTQERVIDNNDIAGWENTNRFPLLITATCTFGGYDDYGTTSGAEQCLLKEKSGAVALFTTVRSVFIYNNNQLTDQVQSVLFKTLNGKTRTIGEILRDAKNNLVGDTDNSRRFTLLGDPSMYLALPEYKVRTTVVNGKTYNPATPDTLRALSEVNLEGMVTDTLGQLLSNFNGRVTMAIFDKAQNLQTLGQDAGSQVFDFTLQRNVIFKGSATVRDGKFKFKFIVPKDINYAFGKGKISYYAENGTPLDAAGADTGIIIGGNSGAVKDDKPPVVQVYLNDDKFVYGGLTNDDPKILVKCTDDYGMNVSGTSLGHDLTAVLDDNVLETIVLNDFYQSAQDDYRTGQALYPLSNLSVGKHTLKVKGWDVANNPGESYTEFMVAENGGAALAHVLNYPNPFTTSTNFQFEHNLAGQGLDIQISVFTVGGRLVKTLQHQASSDGFRVSDVTWDGRDDYGDQLARGVYLYRVKVRGTDQNGQQTTAESEWEKLVILK